MTTFDMVREFLEKFAPERVGRYPARPSENLVALGIELIREEFHDELIPAVAANDVTAVADALADLDYVINNMAMFWGINLPLVTAEVHRSNMAKEGGGRRGDGKIQKPEGWQPPDVRTVLHRQSNLRGVGQ